MRQGSDRVLGAVDGRPIGKDSLAILAFLALIKDYPGVLAGRFLVPGREP